MKLEYVLFDMDGTLFNTQPGVTKSVAYALDKFGIKVDNLSDLNKFIGPPLNVSFADYYGFNEEDVKKAISYYREYYTEKGCIDCEIYPGIKELLAHLKEKGIKIAMATSKPEVYAVRILKNAGIYEYFHVAKAADFEGKCIHKIDIIRNVMAAFEDFNVENAVMIGDRKYDYEGAKEVGMKCILIEYGFGEREELEKCAPFKIEADTHTLEKFLDSLI